MPHHSRLHKFVIDVPAADLEDELAFWQAATGQTLTQHNRHPEYYGADPDPTGIPFLVQQLDDDGPGRVHLDIHTTDLDAEVARLEQLGATRVRQVNDWWIMEDPAGLPFCVIPSDASRFNDDNARRWDS